MLARKNEALGRLLSAGALLLAAGCGAAGGGGMGDGSMDSARSDGGLQGDGSGGDGGASPETGSGEGGTLDATSDDAEASVGADSAPEGSTGSETGSGGDGSSGSETGSGGDGSSGSEAGSGGDGSTGPEAGSCTGSATQSCYSAAMSTAGVGACRSGTQTCMGGSYGPCTGEVDPTPEACNGVDDNCNGMTDEGLGMISCGIGACQRSAPACTGGRPGTCMPGAPAAAETCGNGMDDNCNGAVDEGCGCVYVAPTGNDTTGTGASSAPYLTIQHAISVAGTGGRPSQVCVASGAAAPSTADYNEAVVMRNGIHVYGGYQATGTTWPRVAGCVTRIVDQNALGVLFDAAVTSTTVLDGFTIQGHNDPTNAGVTMRGSTGAVLTNNVINGGSGMLSLGVDVVAAGGVAATPRISQDNINGGTGTARAIGVRSQGSAPVLSNNCPGALNGTGQCATINCSTGSGIRARPAGTLMAGESFGVRLENSPNALVDTSSVCASGMGVVAAVYVTGNAAGQVVRASNLQATGSSSHAVGYWADACGSAAPWVVNNFQIAGNSPVMGARADGVRAVGDCHPVVDSNTRIVGGVESANNDANGVFCARDAAAGVSSRCTVLNNVTIQGSGGGYPPRAAGVRCEDGACARIEFNQLITGNSAQNSYGVVLGNTGTFVNANHITAGCGTVEGDGVRTLNSFARLQNNVIEGNQCNTVATGTGNSWGVRVFLAAGSNEVDLHSNTIFARGAQITCNGRALSFEATPGGAPPGASGIVRNNIFSPGLCPTRFDVEELTTNASPRLLENNDFFYLTPADVLYRDNAATNLTAIAGVNALPGAAANISADPRLNATNHLMTGSPCIDTGTATGAPTTDLDNQRRPNLAGYDMGADEFYP